ncbi:MAG: hypothetical protein ACHQ53_11380 [Polyangiales bacterium]
MTDDAKLDVGSSLPQPSRVGSDGVDPELLALPAPPQGQRLLSLGLLCSVVVAGAALLLHLRADVSYGFAADRVVDIGEATSARLAELPANSYVRVRGAPMLSHMVRYQRALSGQVYAVFPLAGQRQIFVQIPIEALRDPMRTAQGEFSGRLMSFGQLGGRLRAVREYLATELSLPVTAESWVVLAEEPPSAYGWALLLSAVCLAIVVLAAGLIARWFRPV